MKKLDTSIYYVKYYLFFGGYMVVDFPNLRFNTVRELKDYFNKKSLIPVKFIRLSYTK